MRELCRLKDRKAGKEKLQQQFTKASEKGMLRAIDLNFFNTELYQESFSLCTRVCAYKNVHT